MMGLAPLSDTSNPSCESTGRALFTPGVLYDLKELIALAEGAI